MKTKGRSTCPDGLWLFYDIIRPMEPNWPYIPVLSKLQDNHRSDLILILSQVLNED